VIKWDMEIRRKTESEVKRICILILKKPLIYVQDKHFNKDLLSEECK